MITANPSGRTVCAGDTTTFAVSSSDTAASYIWQVYNSGTSSWDTVHTGGAYIDAANDTMWVISSAALNGSLYRAVAYNDSGASMPSDSAMLVVNTVPFVSPIGGATAGCVGSTALLTNSTAGGSWNTSDTAIATVSAGSVLGVAAGSVTISYSVTNGCGTTTVTRMLAIDTALAHNMLTGPSTICVGASFTLSASVAGGAWSASNSNASVSTSGTVTGSAAGIDTIYYTNSNGCGTDMSSAIISVESPLSAATISGVSRICVGSWSSYTTSGTGGVWSSSDASIAFVDTAGFVTGRAQGIAIISYSNTNSCGTVAGVDTIHIDRNASAITGSDSLGVGATAMYVDSAIGGSWTSSDTTVLTIDGTGTATGIVAGTATISYMVTNVCGTSWAIKTVTVGITASVPGITGPDSVCSGSTIALANAQPGGMWSVTNASASITTTGMLTGIIPGSIDTVVYTYTDGFGTSTTSKAVYVDYAPPHVAIGGPTSGVVIGNSYTVADTPSGGTWMSLNPAKIYFTTARNFVPLRAGVTGLVYTYTNACGTAHDTLWVTVPGETDVNEVNGGATLVQVYPNPSTGTFNFNILSSYNETATIEVTNAIGRTVETFTTVTNKAQEINLHQPAGIYMLNVNTAHGKQVTKITINQ